MKIHGHEIPEEFVREVEKLILDAWGKPFSLVNVSCAVRFGLSGQLLKDRLGLRAIDWAWIAHGVAGRILQRLKKAGKIEYLGRSQGWRVKG